MKKTTTFIRYFLHNFILLSFVVDSQQRCDLRLAENLSGSLFLSWAYFPQPTQAADTFSAASGVDTNSSCHIIVYGISDAVCTLCFVTHCASLPCPEF